MRFLRVWQIGQGMEEQNSGISCLRFREFPYIRSYSDRLTMKL